MFNQPESFPFVLHLHSFYFLYFLAPTFFLFLVIPVSLCSTTLTHLFCTQLKSVHEQLATLSDSPGIKPKKTKEKDKSEDKRQNKIRTKSKSTSISGSRYEDLYDCQILYSLCCTSPTCFIVSSGISGILGREANTAISTRNLCK